VEFCEISNVLKKYTIQKIFLPAKSYTDSTEALAFTKQI